MLNQKISISFLIPAKNAASSLTDTTETVHRFLSEHFSETFEIILIPNGNTGSTELKATIEVAHLLKAKFPEVVVAEHNFNISGKGAALKTGFLASKGDKIFFTDADLPYDLNFFKTASKHIDEGYDFITGNRRTPESYFTVPVKTLPFVYSRHLCGLAFNKAVRFLFNIKTQDTQAGIKAMSRRLAEVGFLKQICPGFFFDVEFFLINNQNNFKKNEIPVHLYLKNEKTTLNLLREACNSSYWLTKIYFKSLSGHYKIKPFRAEETSKKYYITADDWGLSPAVNRGILKLAENNLVTRVSILSNSPYVSLHLEELKKIPHLEIGLHLNLTYNSKHSSPLSLLAYTLNPLISGRKKKTYFSTQINEQICLLKNLNLSISHIDGHHHCHIFPYVTAEVAKAANTHQIQKTRLPTEFSLWKTNKFILPLLSIFAKRTFVKNHLEFRPFFYPPLTLFQDTQKLKNALAGKDGFEMIVHPADAGDLHLIGCKDEYNHERAIEYKSLFTLSAAEVSVGN